MTLTKVSAGWFSNKYNVKLAWMDVAGETGYQIKRCTGANCTPNTVITTTGANATSYSDNAGYPKGTVVRYKVIPVAPNCNNDSLCTTVYAMTL